MVCVEPPTLRHLGPNYKEKQEILISIVSRDSVTRAFFLCLCVCVWGGGGGVHIHTNKD